MKKITILMFILGFAFAFSQETKEQNTPSKEDSRSKHEPEKEVKAEFPGGISEFQQVLAKNINLNKVNGRGKYTSYVQFTVNANGETENIHTTGENKELNVQVEEALKSIKTKWKPASYKGYVVKSTFRIPVSVVL